MHITGTTVVSLSSSGDQPNWVYDSLKDSNFENIDLFVVHARGQVLSICCRFVNFCESFA